MQSEITVQTKLKATCTDCGEVSTFKGTRGDEHARKAEYDCVDCGHTIVLNLDP